MVVRRQSAPPWWMPATMLVWVNIHGGFIFGLAAMGLATAVYIVQNWLVLFTALSRPMGSAGAPPALRANEGAQDARAPGSPGMNRLPGSAGVAPALCANEGAKDARAPGITEGRGARPRSRVNVARSVAMVGLTALATLVNPNGLSGALYPLSYLGNNASHSLHHRMGVAGFPSNAIPSI